MEPAGAERHRRSPEGVEARERRDQSNRHIERKSRCHHSPSVNWRRGRESNPRIEVLQTPTLPLGYPAVLANGRVGAGDCGVNLPGPQCMEKWSSGVHDVTI